MQDSTEEEQVQKAVAGDADAQGWCVERFNERLVYQAEMLYGSNVHASRETLSAVQSSVDLVQDTWIVLCQEGWPIRDNEGGRLTPVLLTYLRAVLLNKFSNLRKTIIRRRIKGGEMQAPESRLIGEAPESVTSILSGMGRREQHERVRVAVDSLPDELRQVLRYRLLWIVRSRRSAAN